MKKNEKKYVLIEVVEEREMTDCEMAWELSQWLSRDQIRNVFFEKVVVERFVGTNFFRMPAEKYYERT